jgi:hypothetical protein
MANVSIPQLPPVLGLNGTEQLEAVQSGSSVRITTAQIVSLVVGGGGTTPLPVSVGGTGNSALASNSILLGNGTGAIQQLSSPTSVGYILASQASGVPYWTNTLPATAGVDSISFGTTGLTPSTAAQGVITVAGTLNVTNGGTGVTTSTGSGSVVLSNSPALVTPTLGVASATSITSPIIYGGSTASSTLTLQSTSGVGTTDSVAIKVGNNGAITALSITTTGQVTVPFLATSSSISITPVLSFNASNTSFASGATVSGNYLQTLLQNKSGTVGASTNYVLSNDQGTDSTYYGEFGMNSSTYSSGTPSDFFSINNGIYFSGHDGDITIGSGSGQKIFFAYASGANAHVINNSGALGFNTNLAVTSGTTGFGTSGQALITAGNSAAPSWGTLGASGGGTGQSTYAIGDLLYASATNALSRLADVATGSVLVSGGVGTAPAWSASPTLTTSLTTPLVIGGTAAGSTLTLQSTSGVGSGDQILVKVGNNGATTAATFASTAAFLQMGAGTSAIAPLKFTSGTNLGTATAGSVEYNGTTAFVTPLGAERGLAVTPQYYVNNATRTGPTAATTFVNILPANPSLTASTRYAFEIYFAITKTSANACTGAIGFSITGTAPAAMSYQVISTTGATQPTLGSASYFSNYLTTGFGTAVVATAASAASANIYHTVAIKGTIDTGAGAITSFAPQFQYSTGVPTTSTFQVGAFMYIYPLSATGAVTSVGTWA